LTANAGLKVLEANPELKSRYLSTLRQDNPVEKVRFHSSITSLRS
jgi:hypothetical protein